MIRQLRERTGGVGWLPCDLALGPGDEVGDIEVVALSMAAEKYARQTFFGAKTAEPCAWE